MIRKYFKMKATELRLKIALYTAIENVLNEQKDIINLISNLYIALKDTPVEELQNSFITALAELAHDQAVKEREADKNKENI